MENKNLKLNLLTFEFPKEKTTLYFSETPSEYSRKVHFTNYPEGIETLFPGITTDKSRALYTTFGEPAEGFLPLSLSLTPANYPLLKKLSVRYLRYYFRKIHGLLLKDGFVDEVQVWLPVVEMQTEQWDLFERFSVKVQFCRVSNFPELVISYDGTSKVLKTTVSVVIADYGADKLKRVYHKNRLSHYEHLVAGGFCEFDQARPVLNAQLSNALGYPPDIPKQENAYPKHLEKIRQFIGRYLVKDEFRKLFRLHSAELYAMPPALCSRTSSNSNQLLFGGRQTNRVPFSGLKTAGPFQPPKWKSIQLFYIFHRDDKKVAFDLHEMLTKGTGNYAGLSSFVKINAHVQPGFSIVFNSSTDPVSEVQAALEQKDLNPDIRYIAIYLSPWGKYETSPALRRNYYRMKELLLRYGMTMQAVETQKVSNRNGYFHYSLTNIALAMLAKLDGIPWRLSVPGKGELIIGVGAFRHPATRLQYLGSAFSFDNTGSFNRFEHFMNHETRLLAGSIIHAVRKFVSHSQGIERLIIHFYKTMSQRELNPIMEALYKLELNIPVFIVSINKTESRDLVAFDMDSPGLMPRSGTCLSIGKNRYLLFNNTRYENEAVKLTDGYPFPLKLSIDCTDPSRLDEMQITAGLIEQVYQFSRLYYKSVRQQGLPVTIKYPEILARMLPEFSGNGIPEFGLDTLWFL